MADEKRPKKPAAKTETPRRFTDEERAAMQERAQELKSEARRGSRGKGTDGESEVLAKIAEMEDADRVLEKRIRALVTRAVG